MPPARGKLTQKSDARTRRAQTMDLDALSAMHPQEARVAQQWPHPYTYRLSLTHRQGGRGAGEHRLVCFRLGRLAAASTLRGMDGITAGHARVGGSICLALDGSAS